MLPKCSTPPADTGSANTDELLHEPAAGAAMRGSQTVLANHCVGVPTIDGSPTRSGRSDVTPVSVLSVVMMLTGLPDWNGLEADKRGNGRTTLTNWLMLTGMRCRSPYDPK